MQAHSIEPFRGSLNNSEMSLRYRKAGKNSDSEDEISAIQKRGSDGTFRDMTYDPWFNEAKNPEIPADTYRQLESLLQRGS